MMRGAGSVMVAVGPPVTRRPPHRSRRAELPHRAPASGSDAKAVFRRGMEDFRGAQERGRSVHMCKRALTAVEWDAGGGRVSFRIKNLPGNWVRSSRAVCEL